MVDSVVIDVLLPSIKSDDEYQRCRFPDRPVIGGRRTSGDFSEFIDSSPLTQSGYKICPLGQAVEIGRQERLKFGKVAGYRVSVNIPACFIGHNRQLVNGVGLAVDGAKELLKLWLLKNGCSPLGIKYIKQASTQIRELTPTFLFTFPLESQAREMLAQFRRHSEAVLNDSKGKNKVRKPARSEPPEPPSDGSLYRYSSYVNAREFTILAYVKGRNQTGAFLRPVEDLQLEEELERFAERTLRVEVHVHSKWLQEAALSEPDSWIKNSRAYELMFELIPKVLRFDEGLRTRRLKRSTVEGLKLSLKEKTYLLKHLEGTYVRETFDPHLSDSNKWSKTYSAARLNILAESGIDLNIPYRVQKKDIKTILAQKLRYPGEFVPSTSLAPHVYSRVSMPLALKRLKAQVGTLLRRANGQFGYERP